MKIYYVSAICYEDGWGGEHTYPINVNHNVFNSLDKAKNLLKEILEDCKEEIRELDENPDEKIEVKWSHFDEYDNAPETMEIHFLDSGTIEDWTIYEREVD